MEDQGRCLAERHYIDGRQLEVKLPQSKSAGFDEVVYPGVSPTLLPLDSTARYA